MKTNMLIINGELKQISMSTFDCVMCERTFENNDEI
jgi:hypothetical protein